jgi:hypothetical protein
MSGTTRTEASASTPARGVSLASSSEEPPPESGFIQILPTLTQATGQADTTSQKEVKFPSANTQWEKTAGKTLAEREQAYKKLLEATDASISWADLTEEDDLKAALMETREMFIISTRTLFAQAERGDVTRVVLPETLKEFAMLWKSITKLLNDLKIGYSTEPDATFIREKKRQDLWSENAAIARETYTSNKNIANEKKLVSCFAGIKYFLEVLLGGVPLEKKFIGNPNMGYQAMLCFLIAQVNTDVSYKAWDQVLKHLSSGRTSMIDAFAEFLGKGNESRAAKITVAALEGAATKLVASTSKEKLQALLKPLVPHLARKAADLAVDFFPTVQTKTRVLVEPEKVDGKRKVPARYANQLVKRKQIPQVSGPEIAPESVSARLKQLNAAVREGLQKVLFLIEKEDFNFPVLKYENSRAAVLTAKRFVAGYNERLTRVRARIRTLSILDPDGRKTIKGSAGMRDRIVTKPEKYNDFRDKAIGECDWSEYSKSLEKTIELASSNWLESGLLKTAKFCDEEEDVAKNDSSGEEPEEEHQTE